MNWIQARVQNRACSYEKCDAATTAEARESVADVDAASVAPSDPHRAEIGAEQRNETTSVVFGPADREREHRSARITECGTTCKPLQRSIAALKRPTRSLYSSTTFSYSPARPFHLEKWIPSRGTSRGPILPMSTGVRKGRNGSSGNVFAVLRPGTRSSAALEKPNSPAPQAFRSPSLHRVSARPR